MQNDATGLSPVFYARAAGIGYLIIIVAGLFGELVVRSNLVVPGDAAATAANLITSGLRFRFGLAAELVMLAADVLVAVALYVLLEQFSKGLALLAAFYRLVHAAVVGANLLNGYAPSLFMSEAGHLEAFTDQQRNAMAMTAFDLHSYGYALGLAFFGAHCLVLGYVALRSRFAPRLLGALLMVAGVGYLIDWLGRTLLSNYRDYQMIFTVVVFLPAFVGELSFALWLLWKGGQDPTSRGVSIAE